MRVRTLSRRLGSAALVITLGLSAAACGSDGSDDNTPGASSDNSSKDSGEEAADGELSELAAADFYPAVTDALKEAGTFKYTAVSSSSGSESTMTGEARYTDSGTEMKASSSGAEALEIVLLDQIVYLKNPDMGLGDKWLKIDLDKSGDSMFGLIARAVDPEVTFKALSDPEKVELVAQEDVDGVQTNHYRITIDSQTYVKAMGFPEQAASLMPEQLVTDMWVDADNLPRKYLQDVTSPAAGGAPATNAKVEGSYSDFGAEVDIKAPPAAQVTDQFPGMPGAA